MTERPSTHVEPPQERTHNHAPDGQECPACEEAAEVALDAAASLLEEAGWTVMPWGAGMFIPMNPQQVHACESAAAAFGVEPWEMAVVVSVPVVSYPLDHQNRETK